MTGQRAWVNTIFHDEKAWDFSAVKFLVLYFDAVGTQGVAKKVDKSEGFFINLC